MTEKSNVADKILSDAAEEKNSIIEKAKREAGKIVSEAQKEKKNKIAEIEKDAEDKYKNVYDTEVMKAEYQLKQKVLSFKIDFIESLLDEIEEDLKDFGKKELKQYLDSLFAKDEFNKGELIKGKKEKTLTYKDITDIASKHGIDLKKAKGSADFDYGFKIKSGRAVMDISPADIFRSNKEEFRIELSKMIFPKED
ncbi:MAG: V-type ATP synthase subunit E [candidate division WOR-3 bacterium]|nr:V-type ATP synthase subunit E [candidate division WOR-3 bacterium]